MDETSSTNKLPVTRDEKEVMATALNVFNGSCVCDEEDEAVDCAWLMNLTASIIKHEDPELLD
jgi:hypothetical protein